VPNPNLTIRNLFHRRTVPIALKPRICGYSFTLASNSLLHPDPTPAHELVVGVRVPANAQNPP
jgi:hypothetical protein